MSASEKLKELLEADERGTEYLVIDPDAREAVANALPQIVAVVEQLERVLAPWEKIRGQGGPLATATDEALSPAWEALTALEEALS